jgi:26S proteasome regulatory subunit N1
MLYLLVTAMYPCFLITLNEELISVPITVRVGQVCTVRDSNIQSSANYILQAVDVVGQAGKPWTISGFQTHQKLVRLCTTEQAESAMEDFIPFTHVLEGFVVLQKNPSNTGTRRCG